MESREAYDKAMHAYQHGQHVASDGARTWPVRVDSLLGRDSARLVQSEADEMEDFEIDELAPIQTPWSPLGDGEHNFSYTTESTIPSTQAVGISSPTSNTTSTAPVYQREIKLCLQTSKPPDSFRVTITGFFYNTRLNAMLDNDLGLIGTFHMTFDLTPSTTWAHFGHAFRQAAVKHRLPSNWREGQSMVICTTAKGKRQTSILRREKECTLVFGRETFGESVEKLKESGLREMKVVYYLATAKREDEREVAREMARRARPTYPTNMLIA